MNDSNNIKNDFFLSQKSFKYYFYFATFFISETLRIMNQLNNKKLIKKTNFNLNSLLEHLIYDLGLLFKAYTYLRYSSGWTLVLVRNAISF